MKLIYYIPLILATTLFSGCKKDVYNNNENNAYIQFVAKPENNVVVGVKNAGVMVDNADFGTDKVALYAVKYANGNLPPYDFSSANRVISTISATVSEQGVLDYGTKVEFPDGDVSAYAIYPAEVDKGVEIVDPLNSTPISANIVLNLNSSQQYDLMLAKLENLDRNEHLKGKTGETMTFKHALAQVKVKVYADNDVNGDKAISKVVVNAKNKANLADVTVAEFSNFSNDAQFVLYENPTGIKVVGTTAEDATAVDGKLMLFPGNVASVVITIDGCDYTVTVPAEFLLAQGGVNTITFHLTRLGVVFGDITVSKWAEGLEGNGQTEVMKRYTKLEIPLKDFEKEYFPAVGNYTIEAQINGVHWLQYKPAGGTRTTKIPAVFKGDAISFENDVETLMLGNDDVYLTAIKIYHNDALIFNGKASAYTPNQGKMLIDQKTGKVTLGSKQLTLDLGFGNLGDGSADFPFEVSSAEQLDNIRGFYKAGTVRVLHFAQTQDVNLAPHLKIDKNLATRTVDPQLKAIGNDGGWQGLSYDQTKPVYVNYNGNGFAVRGLYAIGTRTNADRLSLFGIIGKSVGDPTSSISNLVVEGNVQSSGFYVAGIVDMAYNVKFSRCVNKVNIEVPSSAYSLYVGGLLGYSMTEGTELQECGNEGNVKVAKSSTHVAGLIGYTAKPNQTLIKRCYNKGNLSTSVNVTYLGGLVGYLNLNATVEDSYNQGSVSGTSTNGGGIAARFNGTNNAMKNCYVSAMVSFPAISLKHGALVGDMGTSLPSGLVFDNCYYTLMPGSLAGLLPVGSLSAVTANAKLPIASELNGSRVGMDAPWVDVDGVPRLTWEIIK